MHEGQLGGPDPGQDLPVEQSAEPPAELRCSEPGRLAQLLHSGPPAGARQLRRDRGGLVGQRPKACLEQLPHALREGKRVGEWRCEVQLPGGICREHARFGQGAQQLDQIQRTSAGEGHDPGERAVGLEFLQVGGEGQELAHFVVGQGSQLEPDRAPPVAQGPDGLPHFAVGGFGAH